MDQQRFEAIQGAFQRQVALEQEKDTLVRNVRTMLDITLANAYLPEKSQIQNLRTLAAGTTSIEEIRIYVQYQMGRGNKPPIGRDFGQALLDTMPKTDIEKVRLFMGYLYRYYTYVESVRRSNHQSSRNKG